jgi:hypothetical protein
MVLTKPTSDRRLISDSISLSSLTRNRMAKPRLGAGDIIELSLPRSVHRRAPSSESNQNPTCLPSSAHLITGELVRI